MSVTSSNGITGYLISDGDALTDPAQQLAGAYFEVELPANNGTPARPGKVLPEDLAIYLSAKSLLSAYNRMPSLRKAVEFRTIAEKAASPVSLPDSSTMEELDPLSMCLGTEIYVVTDPDDVHEYKVVYDAASSMLVWVDGNFSQSVRGKIQASFAPNPGGSGTPPGTVYRDPLAISDNTAVTAAVLDTTNTWTNGDLTAYGSAALSNAGAPAAVSGQDPSILVGTADVQNGDQFDAVFGGGGWRYFYGRRNDGTSGWTRTPKG